MNTEELKEKLKSEWNQTKDKIIESSAYQNLREKYDNLTPASQKLVITSSTLLLVFLVVLIPFSYFSDSSDLVTKFEEKRALVRDLFKVNQENQDSISFSQPPTEDFLKSKIQSDLQSARLIPEQIRGTEIIAEKPPGIKPDLISNIIQVSLAKLNIKQIVDIGYQLQAIHGAVKIIDLIMNPSPSDQKYFDVIYKLVILKAPEAPPMEQEPAKPVKKGRGK